MSESITRKWICWSPKSVAAREKGREERKRKRKKKNCLEEREEEEEEEDDVGKTLAQERERERERENTERRKATTMGIHVSQLEGSSALKKKKKGKKTFSLFLVVFHFQLSFLLSALNVISFVPCRALRS